MLHFLKQLFLRLLFILLVATGSFLYFIQYDWEQLMQDVPSISAYISPLITARTSDKPYIPLPVAIEHRFRERQKSSLSGYILLDNNEHIRTIQTATTRISGQYDILRSGNTKLQISYLSPTGKQKLPLLLSPDQSTRSVDISLAQRSLTLGSNQYLMEIIQDDVVLASYTITINATFQAIPLGDDLIYIDPNLLTSNKQGVHRFPSFDGHEAVMLTYGCQDSSERILVSHDLQYQEIPACLLLDESANTLVIFSKNPASIYDHGYDLQNLDQETLLADIPLFRYIAGQWHQSYVSFESAGKYIGIYTKEFGEFGDDLHYTRYDLNEKKLILDVLQASDGNVTITNDRVQQRLSLYPKETYITNSLYPGLIASTFVKDISQRRWSATTPLTITTLPFMRLDADGSRWNLIVRVIDDHIYITDTLYLYKYDATNLEKAPLTTPLPSPHIYDCKAPQLSIINEPGQNASRGRSGIYTIVGDQIFGKKVTLTHLGSNTILTSEHLGAYLSARLDSKIFKKMGQKELFRLDIYDDNQVLQCSKYLPFWYEG